MNDTLEPKKSGEFSRQQVLFDEVQKAQEKCPHERIKPIGQTTILCPNCGALWIR